MSDIDGNFGSDPAERTDPVDHLSDPIGRVLVALKDVVRTELLSERQRAEAAEESLAQARRELAAAKAALDVAVSRSRKIEERLFKDLREYVEDSMRAQRGLIAISRQLLQSMGVTQTDPVPTGDPAPASVFERPSVSSSIVASEPAVPLRGDSRDSRSSNAFDHEPGSNSAERPVPNLYEWQAEEDPITDEHRIIDQSNRADMERLSLPSRRFSSSSAFKRRNLLTGS